MSFTDRHFLMDRREDVLNADHLWNIEAVEVINDLHAGSEKIEKMIYFMKDGSVKILTHQELLIKSSKELMFVQYLLKKKEGVHENWNNMILSTIRRRGNMNYNGEYVPMYLNDRDQEVRMQRNTAIKEVVLGRRQLTLNIDGKDIAYVMVDKQEMQRSSIRNLRMAIYQMDENDPDLKGLKETMSQVLEGKEEDLLKNFLKENMFYERI